MRTSASSDADPRDVQLRVGRSLGQDGRCGEQLRAGGPGSQPSGCAEKSATIIPSGHGSAPGGKAFDNHRIDCPVSRRGGQPANARASLLDAATDTPFSDTVACNGWLVEADVARNPSGDMSPRTCHGRYRIRLDLPGWRVLGYKQLEHEIPGEPMVLVTVVRPFQHLGQSAACAMWASNLACPAPLC